MEKLTQVLAIGSRGTSFGELSEAQLKNVKLGELNSLSREHRSDAQLIASRAGKHQDSLGYDARSYVSAGKRASFWLGTLEQALAQKLVVKAKAVVKAGKGEKTLEVYVRTGFDAAQKRGAWGQYFACASEIGGRIEREEKRHGEERREGSVKNAKFLREIVKIEVVK